jgi:hypothetical protein
LTFWPALFVRRLVVQAERAQAILQQRQEVVGDHVGVLDVVRHARRRRPPQRDFLEPDQVRLRALDLVGERDRAHREVRLLDGVPQRRRGLRLRLGRGRPGGLDDVRAQVEVARHDGDFAVRRGAGARGRGEQACGRDGQGCQQGA